jgi:hypothetical protein
LPHALAAAIHGPSIKFASVESRRSRSSSVASSAVHSTLALCFHISGGGGVGGGGGGGGAAGGYVGLHPDPGVPDTMNGTRVDVNVRFVLKLQSKCGGFCGGFELRYAKAAQPGFCAHSRQHASIEPVQAPLSPGRR